MTSHADFCHPAVGQGLQRVDFCPQSRRSERAGSAISGPCRRCGEGRISDPFPGLKPL